MSDVFNPISTYRVQLNKNFNFTDLSTVIPYLQKLGVRTIYASPIFEAAPGSTHGYDGTDPNRINPEIGTTSQLEQLSATLKELDMHWLQDIVPNHMAFHENNKWLMDVLHKGPASEYSDAFDIDWRHPAHPGRLMVPFPGSSLEATLKKDHPASGHFVLCDWKETDRTINYRRFFLVNGLICTNMQNDKIFALYHRLIKECTEKGIFQGLRVDHIDGLYAPGKYLADLRKLAGPDIYIVVEKILQAHETLPAAWPIQGSSGYDFLAMVNNLFTSRNSEFELTAFYYDITGHSKSIQEETTEKKTYILHHHMRGELDNLTRLYIDEGLADEELPDAEIIRRDIASYLVKCPVYRYYDEIPVMDRDAGKERSRLLRFYNRCMQFTGPLMAKGMEDTLMYTQNRFIGHNEVGDSPEYFGISPEEFHEMMMRRRQTAPASMNATSTHDTKRGEDARARLNAMTDLYGEWTKLVTKWRSENAWLRTENAPDPNDEYLVYQSFVATHPYPAPEAPNENYPERFAEYIQKALREAKSHTNWSESNSAYEDGVRHFSISLLRNEGFLKSFSPFLKKVADYGMVNSFSQLALKFCCPGIPDIYQGTELWDLSMVDPDNRRVVDYALRAKLLGENKKLSDYWTTRWSGQIKLHLTHHLLKARNRYHEVFTLGDYTPLRVEGKHSGHILAFIRQYKHRGILVAVPLHLAAINPDHENPFSTDWGDTRLILPPHAKTQWEDLFNGLRLIGPELMAQQLFKNFLVAVFKS